ncbi:MAG: DedA family protein [Propionivibrio sp.]
MIGEFIKNYGYLAVMLGTLLEGEAVLLAAGFACHQGLLDWRIVAALAVLGATLGDQGAFLIGRWKGERLVSRFPSLERSLPRINALMEKYHTPMILFVRFMYGMRIAGPLLLGMSNLPAYRFALLNVIGAVIWASVVTSIGYSFGVTMSALLTDVKEVEEILLASLLVIGGVFWVFRIVRARSPRDRRK